jgi:exodeoxyribonuclease-1
MDSQRALRQSAGNEAAEARLYDGFLSNSDKSKLDKARQADTPPGFSDDRLNALWPRYVARNFPARMSGEQKLAWDQYCRAKLTDGGDKSALANYFRTIAELGTKNLPKPKLSLLEDLQLYGESLISFDN